MLRSLLVVMAAATAAHADTAHPGSVGAALGVENQQIPLDILANRSATLTDLQLHGGYFVHPWFEPGLDLGLGTGDGLRSFDGIADLRVHGFPRWRVSPTAMLGVGAHREHGTAAGDDPGSTRLLLMAGLGVEVHVDQLTIGLDLQLRAVRGDAAAGNGSLQSGFARDGYLAPAASLRGTYRF